MSAAGRFARLLGQGLSLAIGRRPDRRLELAGFGAFVCAWLLATAVFAAQDWLSTPAPREFDTFAPWGHAGVGAALLVIGWLVARVLRRPAAWLTLATLAIIVLAPWSVLDLRLQATLGKMADPARIALAALLAVLAARIAWVAGTDASRLRRLSAGALFALLLLVPWQARAQLWLWYTTEDPAADVAYEPPVLVRDPEALLGRQPELVLGRLAKLAPQVPGHVDLYAVGFAGDGNEGVFRNEVDFLQSLLTQRFGARDRVLPLVNHPDTTATTPIASLTNLRAALVGIGNTMDRDEDVLLLFLTSHGTRDHELVVDFPPLPLRQIEPKDLKDALDTAGIRWRVVVVSSCFSGGFIDALRTPETLVITAARGDRTSFGCGSDSQITWFGKAFLTQALNQTTDLRQAYGLARGRVAAWERAGDQTPSLPQLWAGDRIDAKLAQWRAGLAPGAPVPFAPALRKVER